MEAVLTPKIDSEHEVQGFGHSIFLNLVQELRLCVCV